MRSDDRRRPPDDEDDDLFRDLRSELESIESRRDEAYANDAASPSLGAKPGEPAATGPGGPAPAAYPPEGFDSDEELGRLPTLTPGSGHRPRATPARRAPGRPPRLVLGVLFVVLAAAAFLFWPRGRPEPPLGVGEMRTEVTADGRPATTGPASVGEVDIGAQTRELVPEGTTARPSSPPAEDTAARATPARRQPAAQPPPVPREEIPAAAADAAPAAPAPAEPAPTAPAETGPRPGPDGAWLLQLGAFSTQENAEQFMAQLREKGLQPRAQTGSTADGKLVYKVSLGYFLSREDAVAYARREARIVGGKAMPVHR